ncbi:MAG TPA: hypothetical protein VKD00_07145 [Methyloceanibacter sp.]|nr:hypothetical protein [Methyloceanibacter sp.]
MMQAIQNLRSSDKIRYWIVDYFSPEAIRYGEKMLEPQLSSHIARQLLRSPSDGSMPE